jgi:molybdopterin molybdotransferase
VGDFDLVPRAVVALGGEIVFHEVAIQPGKPILVARLGTAWVAGLPGNPVSVLVGWRMFARPLAEALAGDAAAFAEAPVRVTLVEGAHNRGERAQLLPARLELSGGAPAAHVLNWKGSHDILAAAPADALVLLPPGAVLAAGDAAVAFPLPWRWTE